MYNENKQYLSFNVSRERKHVVQEMKDKFRIQSFEQYLNYVA